jgi:Domain of unknown function (DUF4082)
MTAYSVWNGSIPGGTSSAATGARTDGLLFTVTEAGWQLAGIGFYVPSGETTLAGSSYTGLLWSTTTGSSGTLLGSQAGSGTFTAGAWNWINLAAPPALSEGVDYVAGVSSPDQIQFVHNYWGFGGPGSGGATSGPINVPGYSAAPGSNQQGNASGADAFPGASTGSWYGVDIMVTPVAASPSGLLAASFI